MPGSGRHGSDGARMDGNTSATQGGGTGSGGPDTMAGNPSSAGGHTTRARTTTGLQDNIQSPAPGLQPTHQPDGASAGQMRDFPPPPPDMMQGQLGLSLLGVSEFEDVKQDIAVNSRTIDKALSDLNKLHLNMTTELPKIKHDVDRDKQSSAKVLSETTNISRQINDLRGLVNELNRSMINNTCTTSTTSSSLTKSRSSAGATNNPSKDVHDTNRGTTNDVTGAVNPQSLENYEQI